MMQIMEPSEAERAELPECTSEYLYALEQIIDHADHLTPLALEEENRQLRSAIETIEAKTLRTAATWATHPSGMVSVKRLLDEADKLEGK